MEQVSILLDSQFCSIVLTKQCQFEIRCLTIQTLFDLAVYGCTAELYGATVRLQGFVRERPMGIAMYVQIAEDFSRALEITTTDTELTEALNTVSRELGFDHFALNLDAGSSTGATTQILLHDYPEAWASVCVNLDLGGRDPVRRACDRSFAGFAWAEIERIVPLTRGDRQMLAVGRECGIGDGYTVPRHLPGRVTGSVTFAVQPDTPMPRGALHVAERVGALALACALGLTRMAVAHPGPRLSDRQRECLLWVARGKTAAETATILGISPETVTQHLKMARERYEVHCCQSLILSALFDGIIGFGDVFPPYDSS